MVKESKHYIRLFDQQQSLYEYYARQKGLQSKGMLILMWLYYNPQGISQNKIVQATYSTKQVVNATIKKWQTAGYLSMKDNPADRRHKLLELTPSGKAYAASILDPLEEMEEAALNQMTGQEVAEFIRLSQVYTKALADQIEGGKTI